MNATLAQLGRDYKADKITWDELVDAIVGFQFKTPARMRKKASEIDDYIAEDGTWDDVYRLYANGFFTQAEYLDLSKAFEERRPRRRRPG